MRILIHACCGPCLLPVASKLRDDGHELTAYFYNPNVHPHAEHLRRLEAFKTAAEKSALATLPLPRYEPQGFFRAITYRERERCRLCYRLRLFEVAMAGRDDGFDAFTTTLLISPYQDIERVREAGEGAAAAAGVEFHFEDLRSLFPRIKPMAEELGLYRQKYCGCIYSEIEAEEGRRRKRKSRRGGA